jgi:shikimate kinase
LSEPGSKPVPFDASKPLRSIALAGLPGSGKSTIGPLLAKLRGQPFLDLDAEIERDAGRATVDIFREEGEAGFRLREAAALRRLALLGGERPIVLALGGGAVLSPENRLILRASFVTVWLRVAPRIAARRLRRGAASRPLLAGGNPEERIGELLSRRGEVYAEVADLAIETDGLSPAALAELIDEKISPD